jgi:hypothetical protein
MEKAKASMPGKLSYELQSYIYTLLNIPLLG